MPTIVDRNPSAGQPRHPPTRKLPSDFVPRPSGRVVDHPSLQVSASPSNDREGVSDGDSLTQPHLDQIAVSVGSADRHESPALGGVRLLACAAIPIPHRAPRLEDPTRMLELIAVAEDAYQQLIAEHIDFAERVLVSHVAQRQGAA
jgi:hypothetical protein